MTLGHGFTAAGVRSRVLDGPFFDVPKHQRRSRGRWYLGDNGQHTAVRIYARSRRELAGIVQSWRVAIVRGTGQEWLERRWDISVEQCLGRLFPRLRSAAPGPQQPRARLLYKRLKRRIVATGEDRHEGRVLKMCPFG